MKKILTLFILLIIAAGVGFYFGWVKIEPGTFGIAHSTITGTFEFPLESGNLYWFWQKLVPKTFHVYPISKEPYRIEFETSTALPKSEDLTDFGKFILTVNIKVQYKLNFESAKELFNNGLLINFQTLFNDELISLAEERTSAFIVEGMTRYTYSARTFDYTVLDDMKTELETNILRHSAKYKLEDVTLSIIYIQIPQIDIYVEALKKYYLFMENLYSLKEEELVKESDLQKKRQEEDLELYRLEKYGELISQYPDLLKYFYIQKFGEKAEVLVLPHDEITGFPKMLESDAKRESKGILSEEGAPKEKYAATEEEAGVTVEQPEEKPKDLIDEPAKKKWYEPLIFWKQLKKGD